MFTWIFNCSNGMHIFQAHNSTTFSAICNGTSWIAVRSPSSILSNSSMQQTPISAKTKDPPSNVTWPSKKPWETKKKLHGLKTSHSWLVFFFPPPGFRLMLMAFVPHVLSDGVGLISCDMFGCEEFLLMNQDRLCKTHVYNHSAKPCV